MSRSSPNPSLSASAFVTLDCVAARTPDGHTLFDNLSLALGRERTGLVGRNGVGKTTLLRLVVGLDDPVEGQVVRAGRVGWLPQGAAHSSETVAETLGVAEPLAVLNRVLEGCGMADDLDKANWDLEARIDEALAQVGLTGLDMDRCAETLSGGEQTRLRLAARLLDAPDLLALDEPTNHLDAEGRRLIGGVLERWSGGVLVVSHDRELLRRMDRIVELSSLGQRVYGGNYDLYAERKAAERAAAVQTLETATRDMDRAAREGRQALERKARRDRAGKVARAASSDPKILLDARAERAERSGGRLELLVERQVSEANAARAEAEQAVERVRELAISLPSSGLASDRTVAVLEDVAWQSPEGAPVPDGLSLRITGPERLAITGPNGAGKTTVLKMLAGAILPTRGSVSRAVRTAWLDQDMALLRPDETVLDAWMRLNPVASRNEAHAALARFLFRNVAAQKRVDVLSGGERLRAALACVIGLQPPQLLILDEPTNHLDLDSIRAVEAALICYDGALVVASHDTDFLEAMGITRTLDLGQPQPTTSP
ncbi:ABC-F family ATP-binding cassette domain-containing protein [uncultured Brevundimonas sp.]|uniref:ABC-F family ATP-binding cassette domain-containing protein n=1 Tax=uncultured Brevundimonas sp. TaxID=213418 RepID=UPI0025D9EA31|nr:ABC-F family ATP-binding cassette domain-containing protein [uncultured Brevundimonas sp.]